MAVTATDIAAGWRPLSTAEQAVATAQIAEAVVALEGFAAQRGVVLGGLNQALVDLVVKRMVRRFMKNPDGVRTHTESIDDYSTTDIRDNSLSAGEMFPNDADLSLLFGRGRGAFEVVLGHER